METNSKDKIAKAIIEVMKTVKGMEKNSRVGSGQHAYDGTKDMDVKEVFNEALANNGLCILPIDIEKSEEVTRWEEIDQYSKVTPKPMKSKQSIFTSVKTKYLLMHESGQSVELAGYGQGVDTQDKGAGKATTYALKNCLLLTFLTPVGKMPDTDATHSNDLPVKTAKPTIKEGGTAWVKIVAALANPQINKTIEDVKKAYTVTPAQEEKIKNEVLNQTPKK